MMTYIMQMSPLHYLVAVNAVGFFLSILNIWLSRHAAIRIDALLVIISLLFGSLGVMAAILLFDRKPQKDNMMFRVFAACILVIQLIIILALNGHIRDNVTFAFWDFVYNHKTLRIYLQVINVVALAAFGLDKLAAKEGRSRIPIITLLGLAFIGGSIGALIGMYVFRHKTRKNYFTIGVPLIIIMQMVVLFFVMNKA